MSNLKIVNHALIQHKLAALRDKETDSKEFRRLVDQLTTLITFEATRDLKLKETEVSTPLQKTRCQVLAQSEICLVAILRAGLGMIEGVRNLLPEVKIGHIGLYRDHDTLQAIKYYTSLPANLDKHPVFLLDPMLATGNTAISAIRIVKEEGAKDIKLLSLIAAPEGVEAVNKHHPDVGIYTAALDECLDKNGYIVPGLGDAGDRLFDT